MLVKQLFIHTDGKQELQEVEYAIPENAPDPTQLDRVEAQAVYTAMMTDTLLEE